MRPTSRGEFAVNRLPKRTQKDEDDFIATLRRENPIKSEIIAEHQRALKNLISNQVVLLDTAIKYSEQLIEAHTALNVYRKQLLAGSKVDLASMQDIQSCIPGCKKHRWDNVDGWHRTDEAEYALAT